MLQAAHEAPAGTADFLRIESKSLLFCHLDRNRHEFREIGVAAERSPAISHASEQPGLVARTDLTQFYAALVLGAELFDQSAEIYARICTEKEQHLVISKRKDHRDYFHIEPERLRLFPTEQQRFPLLTLISSRPHGIFLRCPA